MESRHSYWFGPFRLDSVLEIAPLARMGSGTNASDAWIPVSVDVGAVADAIEGAVALDKYCQVTPRAYLLDIPGVARFLAEDGSRVRVELADGAPMMDVCSFLLGSIFGALCHQNGMLPLHASAVESRGAVTAFLGDSGAGKSTLAACLQARGWRIVSDDICLLQDEAVVPVAGWVKLWRRSFEHLGEQPEEQNRVFAADDKYRVYLDAEWADRPALKHVVVLIRAEAGEAPRLEAMTAGEAIAALMEMTYLAYVTELNGTRAELFKKCARVLQGAKAFRLRVPWGLERMDEVLELVERKLLGVESRG